MALSTAAKIALVLGTLLITSFMFFSSFEMQSDIESLSMSVSRMHYDNNTRTLTAKFPKIIHTMWKSPKSPPPAETVRWKKGCKAVNPDHKFNMYYDADLYDFVKKSYPEYLKLFESLKGVYMADMARVLVIYHYGGIYMDLDFYCHRPFSCIVNSLLPQTDAVRFEKDILIVSLEPSIHANIFRDKNRVVIQDFYMATAKHPFFKWFLDDRLAKFNNDPLHPAKGPFSYSIEVDIDAYKQSLGLSVGASGATAGTGGAGGTGVTPAVAMTSVAGIVTVERGNRTLSAVSGVTAVSAGSHSMRSQDMRETEARGAREAREGEGRVGRGMKERGTREMSEGRERREGSQGWEQGQSHGKRRGAGAAAVRPSVSVTVTDNQTQTVTATAIPATTATAAAADTTATSVKRVTATGDRGATEVTPSVKGGYIHELREDILHPLVDSTNPRLNAVCSAVNIEEDQAEGGDKTDKMDNIGSKNSTNADKKEGTDSDSKKDDKDKNGKDKKSKGIPPWAVKSCEKVRARKYFSPSEYTIAVHMWTHTFLGWSYFRGMYNSGVYARVERELVPNLSCPALFVES